MKFVIDVGAALEIVSNQVIIRAEHQLLAPTLFRSQVLSALHEAVTRGRMPADQGRELLSRVGQIPMRLLGDAVLRRKAWEVADRLRWESTYDAEYVALTILQGDALITGDKRLAQSAKQLVTIATIADLSEEI